MDIIEDLKQDLLTRWKAQFDRMPLLAEAAGRGVRTVYATGSRFDVERYRPKKFPAGGRTSKEPVPGRDNCVYLLDAEGRPVHMTERHAHHAGWQGMYSYSAEAAEFTEFHISNRLPSTYARLALRDGQPVSLQWLWVQSRGATAPGMRSVRQAEEILADPLLHFIRIDSYDLQDGRVQSGWSWSEAPGLARLLRLEYSYSDAGKLQRIMAQAENGDTWTAFAARTKTSLKQLSTTLSQRIAGSIIDALQRASFDSPLVMVQLLYDDGDFPSVLPGTQADANGLADPALLVKKDLEGWIELREEDFAPEYIEFMQRIESSNTGQIFTRMIRQAARLVTELGRGQPWAAEDFVAFAIEWEGEGGDLAKVLKACGADAKIRRSWKKRGWI